MPGNDTPSVISVKKLEGQSDRLCLINSPDFFPVKSLFNRRLLGGDCLCILPILSVGVV
jgi:hypothetical protein